MTDTKPRFAWLLNLDAEFELANPAYNATQRLSQQLEQYGANARELLGERDVLVQAGISLEPGFIGRAWCPTPRAIAALRSAGAPPEPHPPVAVLRKVNHRHFAFELGGGLPGQRYLEQRAELEALLDCKERAWLLKRPLACAGRGQLRAFQELTAKEWSWVDASFRNGGLIVEPLIVPTLELSLHGFLWPAGHHEFGEICVQEVSERGVFRGVRRTLPGELSKHEERALRLQGERVATALGAVNYFGPFGIDAYRYEVEGRSEFCSLSEINARYTMGFVVGFPKHPSELILDSPLSHTSH